MQFMNNNLKDADKATLRFRRVGEQEWNVRPGINSIKRYVESVDNVPDPSGMDLGSQFGRGIYSGEAAPEYTSWQKLNAKGQWVQLTLSDLS